MDNIALVLTGIGISLIGSAVYNLTGQASPAVKVSVGILLVVVAIFHRIRLAGK